MPNTLLIAGHRDVDDAEVKKVCAKAFKKMKTYKTLITGMAMGVDIVAAETCLQETDWNIIAAIPCYGQEAKWSSTWQKRYWKILADERVTVVYITDTAWTKGCYFKRNNWMVKSCNKAILFMHDQNSGTGHTYRMLQERGRKTFVYDPKAKLWL